LAIGIASVLYIATSGLLSALLLLLVWISDRYEREPLGLLILSAAWGAVPAVLLSCFMESFLAAPMGSLFGGEAAAVATTVVFAPVVEEGVKAMALLLLILFARAEFDDVLDGMVYGAAVGIGFSFVEDLLYFIGAVATGGLQTGFVVFLLRNLAFLLNHSLFTALTGIGFGLARVLYPRKALGAACALGGVTLAILLHALHNALGQFDTPGILLAFAIHWASGFALLALVPLLWLFERKWVLQRLGREAGEGRIPEAALGLLPFMGRPAPPLAPDLRREASKALLELAFARRQWDDGWDDESKHLEKVRAKIRGYFPPVPAVEG
jgi:RsiW-degrading membrane proteinase PrsW (M82 family)